MEKKIIVKTSPTADTRTCDVTKVTKEQLFNSSKLHILDVMAGMQYISNEIENRAKEHDYTKIEELDSFFKDFKNDFKTQDWWKLHKREERHHLQDADGVRDDVDLIDVIECVVDIVMAGLARSGKVTEIKIPLDVLNKAVQNTAKKLESMVEVTED